MPTSLFLQQAAFQNADSWFWQIIAGLALAVIPALTTFLLMRRQQTAVIHSTEAGTIKMQAETAALMVRDYDEIMERLRSLHNSTRQLESERDALKQEIDKYKKDTGGKA